MLRQQYPYNNRGNNPFQNMNEAPTPITVGYVPSVDPAVLQQSLGRADQRFNTAKQMPEVLTAGLNKSTMTGANRQFLSEHYDKEIKDIQETVHKEYGDDWGKASDFILNRVNNLQGYMKQAEQRYAEDKPMLDAIAEQKLKGFSVYDPNEFTTSGRNSMFTQDENGNISTNSTKNNAELYHMDAAKARINNDVSKGLTNWVRNLGATKVNAEGIGNMLQTGEIKGISDKGVVLYAQSNPEVINTALINNRDFVLSQANKLDTTPEKIIEQVTTAMETDNFVKDPVVGEFLNIIQGQTSKQNHSRYQQFKETSSSSSGNNNNNIVPIDTRYLLNGVTVKDNQGNEINLEEESYNSFNRIKAEDVEDLDENATLKIRYEHGKKIKNEVVKKVTDIIDPENVNMSGDFNSVTVDDTPIVYTKEDQDKTLKLLDSGFVYSKDSRLLTNLRKRITDNLIENTDNIGLDTKLETVHPTKLFGTSNMAEANRNDLIEAGITTVGEAYKVLSALELSTAASDKNYISYHDLFDEANAKYVEDSKTKLTDYGEFGSNVAETEETVEFLHSQASKLLPEALQDKSLKELSEYSFTSKQSPRGPILKFTKGENKHQISLMNMTEEAVNRIAATLKAPSIFTEYSYQKEFGDKYGKVPEYKGEDFTKDNCIDVNGLKVTKRTSKKGTIIYAVMDPTKPKGSQVMWSSISSGDTYGYTKTGALDVAKLLSGQQTPTMKAMEEGVQYYTSNSAYKKILISNLGINKDYINGL